MRIYRVEFGSNVERDDFVADNFEVAVRRANKRAQQLRKEGYAKHDVEITSLELVTTTDF